MVTKEVAAKKRRTLKPTFAARCRALNACDNAVDWIGRKSLKTAWETCERADWMLWLAGRVEIDRKVLVLAACDCAETALKYVPVGEERPARAIQMARGWCVDANTLDEVNEAVGAAAEAAEAAEAAGAAEAAEAAEAAWADKQMADLVRKRITYKMIEVAMKGAK